MCSSVWIASSLPPPSSFNTSPPVLPWLPVAEERGAPLSSRLPLLKTNYLPSQWLGPPPGDQCSMVTLHQHPAGLPLQFWPQGQLIHCSCTNIFSLPSTPFLPAPSSTPQTRTSPPPATVKLEVPIGYGSFGVVWYVQTRMSSYHLSYSYDPPIH